MKQYFIYIPFLAVLLVSCVKTKVENQIPPLSTANTSSSTIRLFNFSAGNMDITVNNYPLTSYVANVSTGGTPIGLSLFPLGYWPGSATASPFYIPNSLLDKNGRAHVQIKERSSLTQNGSLITIDTILQDNALSPNDYYVMDNVNHLYTLSRLNAPPAQPQDVRIRVINLGSPGDPLNLSGPVTLTYSDGTVVSPLTSGVSAGTAGSYAEIPYGAYQFKLFMSGSAGGIDVTRQLTELPLFPYFDPCGSHPVQEGIFPVLRTFKPGGVYSLVINGNFFNYFACNSSNTTTVTEYINAYRVITELDPGTNITFARMQGVNALNTSAVTFQIDGQPLGSALGFGQHTDYSIYVQGSHQVSVLDGSGNMIVQKSITLNPYDNYCLWAYADAAGKPDIDFAAVDMTGEMYSSYYFNDGSFVDDGTNGSLRIETVPYPWETRFLNLAPDLPYATFTADSTSFSNYTSASTDSSAFSSAYINMSPGYLPPDNPYILFPMLMYPPAADPPKLTSPAIPPRKIRVYASSPGPVAEVPGTLLLNVAPAVYTQYNANPALYTRPITYSEPGVYTTALIGKVTAPAGDPMAARLIVIKHNN